MEVADFCAELPDVSSCDVGFGMLAVDTVVDAVDDSISDVVKETEPACEDCVGTSGDFAVAEVVGVEETAEPEEIEGVAGADDAVVEEEVKPGEVAGAEASGAEEAAEPEDSAGADDAGVEEAAEPEDDADAEGEGVEEAAAPEEIAGTDDGGIEDGTGAGGFADALGVVEDAAGCEDSAGADDTAGGAEDATGSVDSAGADDTVEVVDTPGAEGEGAAELCCGPPGPTGPPPVQEA